MKRIISFVLAMAVCFGLAACKKPTDESVEEGVQTLRVTVGNSDEEIMLNSRLQKAFVAKKGKEGVKVKFFAPSTFTTGTYQQSLSGLEASNTLGDIIYTYDDKSGTNVAGEVFETLDEIIEADSDFDMSKYDKTIIDSARTYGGKIAYMPRSFDQITLFINVSLFKKIGLENEVPTKAKYGDNWENWTWDACLELLAKIRTALDTKYGKSSKNYYPLAADLFWNPVYNCIVRSFGGNCVDVENMDTGFNPENPAYAQTVKAFDFMNKLVSEKYSPAGQGQFTNGFEAMWIGTRPSVTGVVSDGKIEVAFAPLPKFTDSITGLTDTETFVSFGSSGYALNSNSKNKTLAWEFIKFTASEEGQKIIASAGSCVPIISSQLTADGDWTKVEGLENVDQSAFIFRGNTLIPATYARGINIKNEFAVYTDSKNEIANNLGKTTDAAVIVKKLYDATKAYIKK